MKQDPQRVLAGSLNLLAAADKTPDNDALALLNFRVDQAGVLRVGDSYNALNAFSAAPVHTIVRLSDLGVTSYANGSAFSDIVYPANCFLVGAGTSLYLYIGTNNTTQTIASGFDGNPLSITFWNGFIWVMNQAKQIVISPPAMYLGAGGANGPLAAPWLPSPPTSAITVADSPTTLGNLTNGTTYTYFCTFSYSFVNSSGTAVTGESAASSPVQAVAAEGQIFVSDIPQPSQQLIVTGWNGPVSLQVNLYRQSPTQTTPYRIPPGSQSTSFQDTYSDAQLAAWNQTQGSAGSPQPAAPGSVPTLTPGPYVPSGSSFAGNTYQYYATFVTLAGLETNPGPVSASVTTTEGAIALSTIQTSSDSSVWARRIYRTGGTLGGAYQVAQISDNTTTTYLDVQSDLQLTETGILMPGSDPTVGDNSGPPPALGCIGPYLNYLLAWAGTYGNRLYWSQNGVPLFPGSADPAVGNWVNVGAPDDHIVAVTIHSRMAVIYKQRSIWRLLGDPVNGVLEQSNATVGALGMRAVCNAGEADYFISTDGLFLYDLDVEHRASENIDPVFMGTQWTALGAADVPYPTWNPTLPVCAWLNGSVLISDGSSSAFLLHVATNRIAQLSSNAQHPITAVCTIGSTFQYWIGDSQGSLLAAQQSSVVRSAVWQTRFLDQELGDQPKAYSTLVLDAELNGATATVYAFNAANNSAVHKSAFVVATLTGSARFKYYVDLQESDAAELFDNPAPHLSVRVELTCASGVAPAIHGLYIYYEVEARATQTLATLPFPLDAERGFWQVKEIEYDVANANGLAATVSAAFSTDEPGNSVVVRQTDTITLPTTGNILRRNFLEPQNTSGVGWWTGRLFQLYLSCTAQYLFRAYGARLLARKIGTYIEDYEAQNGFVWDSWWLNFGSIQVKVFDQIKLEIESSATLTVTVSTELPGETPAVVATQTLTCVGPRRWYTVELPADCIGRDVRIQIASTGAWTFYAGKISLRTTGRYLSAVQGDQMRTLEQDFGTERVKWCRKLEIDLNGTVTLNLYTDEPAPLQIAFTQTISTTGRQTVKVRLPQNIRGRLWRIDLSTTATARVYAIRGWMRVIGEAAPMDWNWQSFALEASETLPAWVDLPVAPTPEEWTWVPAPLEGLPVAD